MCLEKLGAVINTRKKNCLTQVGTKGFVKVMVGITQKVVDFWRKYTNTYTNWWKRVDLILEFTEIDNTDMNFDAH